MGSSSSKSVQQTTGPVSTGDPLKDAYDAFMKEPTNAQKISRLEMEFRTKDRALDKELSDLQKKITDTGALKSKIAALLDTEFKNAMGIVVDSSIPDQEKSYKLDQFKSALYDKYFKDVKTGGGARPKKASTHKKPKTAPKKKTGAKPKKITAKSNKKTHASKQSKQSRK